MAKNFRPSGSLIHYLKMVGFEDRSYGAVKYFVNKRGNQIRINFERRTIAFLNKGGFLIDKFTEVSTKQISAFAKLEYHVKT